MHSRRAKKMVGTQSTIASDPNPSVPAQQEYLTSAVFGNDLVFDAIAGYLGTADLKILRQTCKLLLGKVNSHRTFTSNVQIPIMDESIEAGIVGQCTFELENARIVLKGTSPKNMTSVLKKLTHVADLKLFHLSNDKEGAQGQTKQCENTIRACYNSIGQFSNLRTLTLDINLLGYSICTTPLKNCVSTIKELRILGESLNYMPTLMPPLSVPGILLAMRSKTEWKVYRQNMKNIGSLDWRLKSFVFKLKEEIPPEYHNEALNGILTSSALTLETIHTDTTIQKNPFLLTFTGLSHLGNVHEIVFPSLKAVSFSIENENNPRLASFLAIQPPLESIQLITQLLDQPWIILDAIKANCCSISNPKLHTLEIGGHGLLKNLDHLRLWEFLKDLKELKNFKCIRGSLDTSWYDHGYELLEYLLFTLHSLEIGWQFGPYAPIRLGVDFIFNCCQNLRVLKMIECGSTFLNDSLLQFMCSTLTGLRVLHFGRSQTLTDIGLTGVGNESDGKPLTNLKGLQELAIVWCPNFTDEALVQSIQFLELKVVKLVCNLSDDAVVEIAKNNPSLELMAVGPPPSPQQPQPFEFQILCSRMAEVNPRIRRIIREHSSPEGEPTFSSVEALRTPSSGGMRIGPLITRNHSIISIFPQRG